MLLQGVPLFPPLIQEDPLTQWHKILSQNTRNSRLSYGENPKSLSHVGSSRYRVVTDGQTNEWTDRITIANMHYSSIASYAGSRM